MNQGCIGKVKNLGSLTRIEYRSHTAGHTDFLPQYLIVSMKPNKTHVGSIVLSLWLSKILLASLKCLDIFTACIYNFINTFARRMSKRNSAVGERNNSYCVNWKLRVKVVCVHRPRTEFRFQT